MNFADKHRNKFKHRKGGKFSNYKKRNILMMNSNNQIKLVSFNFSFFRLLGKIK